MAGPIWVRWLFALLFARVGVCCVARLLAARRVPAATTGVDDPRMTVAELLTAAGMTTMFLPVAAPIPPRWWAAVFAADTAWLGFRILRPPRVAVAAAVGRGGYLGSRLGSGAQSWYAGGAAPSGVVTLVGALGERAARVDHGIGICVPCRRSPPR